MISVQRIREMLKDLPKLLLVSSLLISSVASMDDSYSRCNCDEDGYWSIENILDCQRVSDFLIAIAYFSIPIELLYFVSCSNLPFRWVLFEFISFIVLCGMTHLINSWTYGPHTFQLSLALTVFKILTALVSCATAITLATLIPLLLKLKVREFMLKKKTCDLNREVGIIKRQSEAGRHVRMLTQEIRKSLDRHTILYTTMVELSKTLDLQNCAVWMPNEDRTEMILTHELKGTSNCSRSIPYSDPDVRKIKESEEVRVLSPESVLGVASSGGLGNPGAVAAIRMPMLRVSNFKGGTPQLIKACYAILVLDAPNGEDRKWHRQELEIIQVVADQVAVAISHAAVLEESQLMRDKLVEQNRALQMAQKNAMMASQARNSFQRVMSNGMRKPMHTILGLLSLLQEDGLNTEQKLIIETMMKANKVLSLLINDVMDDSPKESGRFPSEIKSLRLHGLVKEAGCLARCLCVNNGFSFTIEVDRFLPDHVLGDERRVFQVILHMVGNLLDSNKGRKGGSLRFRVFSQHEQGRGDQRWATWRSGSSDGSVYVRFEVEVIGGVFSVDDSGAPIFNGQRHNREVAEEELSFRVCQKLVELMQGNIWAIPNQEGRPQLMALVLRFQLGSPIGLAKSDPDRHPTSLNTHFKGLQVLLADEDDMNRAVTRKLLEKIGCSVMAVSSGYECLSAVGPTTQLVLLDLHLNDLAGFEVATRIRKLRSQNWPLIVALTASGEECGWERIKLAGINGVVQKPVLLEGMVDELRRVLALSSKSV
ncbi:hypothetical protein V2J09_014262 [Rumex salicifolius]